MLRWTLLAAAVLALLALSPLSASVTCNTPTSNGAVVDTVARCQYFVHYELDGKAPDVRIARAMHLGPSDMARSIALVVSVSQYSSSQYNLDAAAKDVVNLTHFLVDDQKFDEVIVLQNDQATIENIRYFLREYGISRTNYYRAKVRFLFAYSGHGSQIGFFGDGSQPASATPSVGLVLSGATDSSDYKNIYGLNEIRGLFNDLAKNTFHFLALINACFGGDVFVASAGGSMSEPSLQGAYAVTAGRDDEEVYTAQSGEGSQFFEAIIDGISSGDADTDALNVTLQNRQTDPLYGIVRLSALDGYLSRAMAFELQTGETPKSHHWIGSVEPYNVRADGGFFFLQHVPDTPQTHAMNTVLHHQLLATLCDTPAALPAAAKLAGRVILSPAQGQIAISARRNDGFGALRAAASAVRGIDISQAEGTIDWTKIAAQGIGFAYIKATQGDKTRDAAFAANWKASHDARLPHGAYHIWSFCTPPLVQAANIIVEVPREAGALPVAVRLEYNPGQNRSNIKLLAQEGDCAVAAGPAVIQANLRILLNKLTDTYGVAPVINGNDFVLDTVLGSAFTKDWPLWRIQYGLTRGAPPAPWTLWRYTMNQTLDGIATPVNVSVLSK